MKFSKSFLAGLLALLLVLTPVMQPLYASAAESAGTMALEYRYGTNNLIQINTDLPSDTPCVNFTAGDNGCSIDQSGNTVQWVGWIGMENVNGTIVLTFHFNSAFEAGQSYVLPKGAVFGFTDGKTYTLDGDYTFTFDGSSWAMDVQNVDEPEAATLEFAYRWGNSNTIQVNTDLPSDTPCVSFTASDNGCSIDQSANKVQWFGWAGMDNVDGTIVITFHFNQEFTAGQEYFLPAGAVFGFTDGKTYTLSRDYTFRYDGAVWAIVEPVKNIGLSYRYGTDSLIQYNTDLPDTTPIANFLATDNGSNLLQSGDRQVGWIEMSNADGTIVLTFHFNAAFAAGQKYTLGANSVFGFTDGSSYVLAEDITMYRDAVLYKDNVWGVVHSSDVFDYYISDGNVTITDYTGSATNVVIPEMIDDYPVTRISATAFRDCVNMTDLTIPGSVSYIGWVAFYDCENLENVYYTGTLKNWCGIQYPVGDGSYTVSPTSNPMYYAKHLYIDGELISGVLEIPEEITSIGRHAFLGCEDITAVVFHGNNLTVQGQAFALCTSLTQLYFKGEQPTYSPSSPYWSDGDDWCEIHNKDDEWEGLVRDYNCFMGVTATAYYPVQYGECTCNQGFGGNITWVPITECVHIYDSVITEPTLTKPGYTTYTCYVCDDSYVADEVPAIGIGELKFCGASLMLKHDLTINYLVDANLFIEDAYTAPYVTFTVGNATQTVTEYTVRDGMYIFACSHLSPSQIGDTMTATIYADLNGEQHSASLDYGVSKYCYAMLKQTDDAKLRTLLVDLLNYGAAAQTYTWYKDKTLCNADLTAEQLAWGTATVPGVSAVTNTKYATVENKKVSWKGASLILDNSVTMRFRFAAESTENLSVKISAAGSEWTVSQFAAADLDGQYYADFNGLTARQMRENVYVTVYEGDTAVSNTLLYSIESYAAAKQNDSNAKLVALLVAMMRYGDSAAAYLN